MHPYRCGFSGLELFEVHHTYELKDEQKDEEAHEQKGRDSSADTGDAGLAPESEDGRVAEQIELVEEVLESFSHPVIIMNNRKSSLKKKG